MRTNPATSANTRAGNLLLCKKPLKVKRDVVYGNGCNSWKGRFYDKAISQLISTTAFQAKNCTEVHIIAGLSLAYLGPPSTRARARARGGSENQRPWPADKVER